MDVPDDAINGEADAQVYEYPKEPVKEEEEDEEEEEEEEEEKEEKDDEDKPDLWAKAVLYARVKTGNVSKEKVVQEPYLSQFVSHMKDYVEDAFQFVKQMEDNKEYKKIDEMIDRYEQDDYDRDEAVDTAWHNRRFLVKRIIEEREFEPIEIDEENADDTENA